jgi:DNA-binding transcriptional ArsR family regulator
MRVQDEHVLAMMLRHGAIEVGASRSTMQRVTFRAGEMGFHPRHSERWVGTGNQERLLLGISDAALRAARQGIRGTVELGHRCKMVDVRLAALVKAVNAERIAGFPSGRLFLDSIEQAIAAALVDAYVRQNRSVRQLRGGLGPARLRLVKELVHAKMEDELTLGEMAERAELSPAHFSRNVGSLQARHHTNLSCVKGSSVQRRCCARPRCGFLMLQSRADSKRSSTLPACSAGFAVPAPRSIDTRFCAKRQWASGLD